jgi:hypothetical protein
MYGFMAKIVYINIKHLSNIDEIPLTSNIEHLCDFFLSFTHVWKKYLDQLRSPSTIYTSY